MTGVHTYSTPLAADLNPGSTAAAYAAGNTVGTVMDLAAPTPMRSGEKGPVVLVETLVLSDAEKLDGELDLVLFDEAPTAVLNNAVWAPSAADLTKVAGVIKVTGSDWSDFSANSAATRAALVLTVRMKNPPHLYGLFIARSAINFAAAGSLKGKLSGFVN
jgi:hypothetical protein